MGSPEIAIGAERDGAPAPRKGQPGDDSSRINAAEGRTVLGKPHRSIGAQGDTPWARGDRELRDALSEAAR